MKLDEFAIITDKWIQKNTRMVLACEFEKMGLNLKLDHSNLEHSLAMDDSVCILEYVLRETLKTVSLMDLCFEWNKKMSNFSISKVSTKRVKKMDLEP